MPSVPPSPGKRGTALAATIAAYIAVAWFATDAALAVHTPCASDFEGGCGYGKVWAGVLSWFAAWAAVGLAVGIGAFAGVMQRFKVALIGAAAILALPPAAYVVYGLYTLGRVAVTLMK